MSRLTLRTAPFVLMPYLVLVPTILLVRVVMDDPTVAQTLAGAVMGSIW